MMLVQNREAFSDITISTNNQEHIQNCKRNSNKYKDCTTNGSDNLKNKQIKTCKDKTTITTTTSPAISEFETSSKYFENTECGRQDHLLVNVMAVSEYANDIFDYLYELDEEVVTQFLNKQYTTKEIINKETLFNWIVKVHMIFGFLEETLYLTIYIIEKYQFLSSLNTSHIEELQLLGITSLFIAAKFEEVVIPGTIYYAFQTDGNYSITDIIKFERMILRTVGYDLSFANPMNFLRRLTLVDDFDLPRRTIAKYLLEITAIDSKNFMHFPRAQCAAASLFLSRRMFGKHEWDSKFVSYSGGYKKKDIVFICKLIIKFLLSPIVHSNFQVKYEATRYLKASIVCKEWVLAIMKQQRKRKGKKYKNYLK